MRYEFRKLTVLIQFSWNREKSAYKSTEQRENRNLENTLGTTLGNMACYVIRCLDICSLSCFYFYNELFLTF